FRLNRIGVPATVLIPISSLTAAYTLIVCPAVTVFTSDVRRGFNAFAGAVIPITLVCCKRSPVFKFAPMTAKTIPFLIKLGSYTPSDTVTVNSASPLLLVCVGTLLNDTRLEVKLERATAIGVFGIVLPSLSIALILTLVSPPRTEIVSNGL